MEKNKQLKELQTLLIEFKKIKLGELLTSNNIQELFELYKKSDEIYKKFQEDTLAYRKGERKTHPFNDKPSWDQKRKNLFKEKIYLDNLVNDTHLQIIRQHSEFPFQYNKQNGLPSSIFFHKKTLRVAEENAFDNHGHSDYAFEEFEISEIERIPANGRKRIFPIRKVNLKFLGTKTGHGEYDFKEEFFK